MKGCSGATVSLVNSWVLVLPLGPGWPPGGSTFNFSFHTAQKSNGPAFATYFQLLSSAVMQWAGTEDGCCVVAWGASGYQEPMGTHQPEASHS